MLTSEQTSVYDELLGELRRIQNHFHLDEDEFLELIVLFVQKTIKLDDMKRRDFFKIYR